jgi:hypothetical protein
MLLFKMSIRYRMLRFSVFSVEFGLVVSLHGAGRSVFASQSMIFAHEFDCVSCNSISKVKMAILLINV